MFVWKESFYFLVVLFLTIGLSALLPSVLSQTECTSDKDCQNSFCIASSCQCQKGFWGTRCEHCRFRLTNCHGIISDGKGKYAESAKCSWLVEPQRYDILNTAFDELDEIKDFRLTLQVTFYGEIASDCGGPRREFFRLCLQKIKEKYFDNGLRDLLVEDYEKAGIIMSLSILQNGPIPRFVPEEILQGLFVDKHPSPCVASLRKGFEKLGLIELGQTLPTFLHLLRPSQAYTLTRRKLVSLLKPSFSEEGSNSHRFQLATYEKLSKYVREVASGRRSGISLGDILQFITGSSEEPTLGFAIQPSIQFRVAISTGKWYFVPTSNTCSQTLYLPIASLNIPLPDEDELFEVYDHAFKNAFFGLV